MMSWRTEQGRRGGSDELGRDPELSSALKSVDPASRDPNYWMRFHRNVMSRAGAELSRRRLMAELTMGDVLSSWARAIVPTALLAAAVAALVLARTMSVQAPARATVEDLLVAGLGDQSIPAALSSDAESGPAVAFAGESF